MLPVEQIERFSAAVELLGGQHVAARLLKLPQATIGDLCNGQRPLHFDMLHAISQALILHANACRLMERRLNPAFLDNILPEQVKPSSVLADQVRRSEARRRQGDT